MGEKVFCASLISLVALFMVSPQMAVAQKVGNLEFEPHEGLSVVPDESGGTGVIVRIDLSKYDLHGDTIIITDNLEVISFDSHGDRTSVSRNCIDRNAGCWTSGLGMGDLQFSGTGTATGY